MPLIFHDKTDSVRKTIVVIDDDSDDLQLICEMSGLIGYSHPIETFQKPETAIAYILSGCDEVILIITDINMPRIDGPGVRKRMTEAGSPYSEIPVVLLSTSKTEQDEINARKLNIQAYYKKPSTLSGFKEILINIKKDNGL